MQVVYILAAAASPAQTWEQCGGIGFDGPTSCATGLTCTKLNGYYSQCLAAPDSSDSAQQWEQCGGRSFAGPTTCASGLTCTTLNEYYSQCLRGSATDGGNPVGEDIPARSPGAEPASPPAIPPSGPRGSGSGGGTGSPSAPGALDAPPVPAGLGNSCSVDGDCRSGQTCLGDFQCIIAAPCLRVAPTCDQSRGFGQCDNTEPICCGSAGRPTCIVNGSGTDERSCDAGAVSAPYYRCIGCGVV